MTGYEHTTFVILIGLVMIGLTIVVNTAGVVFLLKYLGRHLEGRAKKNKQPHLFRAILSITIGLLVLHLAEAYMWAVLYRLLPAQPSLESMHDAFYFSIVTLTTLGYGDITLSGDWQLLSGLESMIGIIMFGMTTALLYAVVQKCWQVRHKSHLDNPDY